MAIKNWNKESWNNHFDRHTIPNSQCEGVYWKYFIWLFFLRLMWSVYVKHKTFVCWRVLFVRLLYCPMNILRHIQLHLFIATFCRLIAMSMTLKALKVPNHELCESILRISSTKYIRSHWKMAFVRQKIFHCHLKGEIRK